MKKPQKIILAGFKKFGDYPNNASDLICRRLDNERLSGFIMVPYPSMPCEIPRVGQAANLIAFAKSKGGGLTKARAIIVLGMSSEKTGLCIEVVGKNMVSCAKYLPPEMNNWPITDKEPPGHTYRVDLKPWHINKFRKSCKKHDVPLMDVSEDAGGFCCNHLIYSMCQLRQRIKEFRDPPFIFMHVPCSPECVADMDAFTASGKTIMTIELMVKGIELLLQHLEY